MPPARQMKASLRLSIFSLRSAMLTVRIISLQLSSRKPGSRNISGAIPTTWPPACSAPRAQAPIRPSRPPPKTRVCPASAISLPSVSAAAENKGMPGLGNQPAERLRILKINLARLV